jgi:hypothetical protein
MGEEEKKNEKEPTFPDKIQLQPVQKCIDPITGRDVTAEYVESRLIELENLANVIINFALWRKERNPDKEEEIFKETEEYLRLRIGHGSIGPATAAAGPLMMEKLKTLHELFGLELEGL